MEDVDFASIKTKKPQHLENVNYKFYQNKDGNLVWRKMEIINPVLYIHLVNLITQQENWLILTTHFKKCSYDDRIKCCSIPIDCNRLAEGLVTNWWGYIEQKSLELSLDYNWLAVTDITDCYGSIYTHSISWAIHGKEKCKQNVSLPQPQREHLFGDDVDHAIGMMTYNQTNGIPQGSILMDFIAEIVLAYADSILLQKISENDISHFQILRYRDDYRIFAKSKEEVVMILRLLSEVLSDLNFKLNTQKTFISQELINDSIKPDKLYWNSMKQEETTLQKHLLIIHKLAKEHTNSGSLSKALTSFMERINPQQTQIQTENIPVLVAILTDIAVHNSKVYALVATIIAKILSYETADNKDKYFRKVISKLSPMPNVGFLLVWIQRMKIKDILGTQRGDTCIIPECEKEPLCRIVESEDRTGASLWVNDWLKPKYKKIIEETSIIIPQTELEAMPEVPDDDEVKLFVDKY